MDFVLTWGGGSKNVADVIGERPTVAPDRRDATPLPPETRSDPKGRRGGGFEHWRRKGGREWRETGMRGETDVFIDRNAEATSKGEIGNLGKVRARARCRLLRVATAASLDVRSLRCLCCPAVLSIPHPENCRLKQPIFAL